MTKRKLFIKNFKLQKSKMPKTLVKTCIHIKITKKWDIKKNLDSVIIIIMYLAMGVFALYFYLG